MTKDESIERKIANLSPYYRDYCEVWDSSKKSTLKVMPGTCEACVWGSGAHSVECCWEQEYRALCERAA